MRADVIRAAVDIDVADQREQISDRRAALDWLALRCGQRAYRIAYDLFGNATDAEDAVQDALARACDGYGELRESGALEGWFYRILVNQSLKVLRRRRIGRALAALWPGERTSDGDAIPDPEPAVDASLSQRRQTAQLLSAIHVLPPMQKAAVVLRYGHDLSVEQTGELLGVGRGTVKTHLVRGLRRLRAELEES